MSTIKKPRTKKVVNKVVTEKAPELISEKTLNKGLKGLGNSKKEVSKKDFNIVHLAPNVTGKMLMNQKFEANRVAKNEILEEVYSISASLKRAKNHLSKQGFFESFKGFKAEWLEELTPKNLLPLQTEKQRERKNPNVFSIFMTMTLIEKYYKNKLRLNYVIKSAK